MASNAKAEPGAANPEMGNSAFRQEHVHEIALMTDISVAKKRALEILEKSTANSSNRAKMKLMISNSKSTTNLAMGMQNHILAHPSEGLKVL